MALAQVGHSTPKTPEVAERRVNDLRYLWEFDHNIRNVRFDSIDRDANVVEHRSAQNDAIRRPMQNCIVQTDCEIFRKFIPHR